MDAPTVVQGELMELLPRVSDMLEHFETILPAVESLWFPQQDEVYFMGDVTISGRHLFTKN